MREMFYDGGWTFVTILGLSLLAWTILAWKWLHLRAEQADGLQWMRDALGHLARQEKDAALLLCRKHRGISSRLLCEAVYSAGRERRFLEHRLASLLRAERTRLRGHLPLVATTAGLCPLLGLLGTVLGMMTTFDGITAGGTVQPDALAHGISQALVTTQAGLVMALPLLLMYGVLRSKMDRFLDAVGLRMKQVETLLCGN